MKINRIGTWFILGGLLLVAAALGLSVHNLREEVQAANAAADALREIRAETNSPQATHDEGFMADLNIPDEILARYTELSTIDMDGQSYVRVTDIADYVSEPYRTLPTIEIDDQTYIEKAQLTDDARVTCAELPTVEIDGHSYIRTVDIPDYVSELYRELPIAEIDGHLCIRLTELWDVLRTLYAKLSAVGIDWLIYLNASNIPDYVRNPYMEMPTAEINGQTYVGVVEIPALELSLPVISEWSYPRLKISPCRYSGSAYLNNLIILAHNYQSHFGTLKNLQIGDIVYFTDMEQNVFAYEVVEMETLGRTDVEKMTTGDWDLTLFTCTVGGKTRVTVRCQRTEKQQ